MSHASDQNQTLTQLKRALETLKTLRARLEAVEQARREPIAIIGMGCRFPGGADTPQAFWHLLKNGVDAITEVPVNRWDANALYDPDFMAPGRMNSRWGGFLEQVAWFDPGFFGISPREATHMDPQQRLLLEVAYEALEDAGQPLKLMAGSPTGVFIGIHSHSNDYTWMQFNDLTCINTHTGTGTAHSIAANRLSYTFDLRGPSMVVDTACSSSLIAVHLACQSLHNEECNLALAGGVNLMLSPEATITFSKLQMMAADGRCKTFDARADGFVRGEGCGLIVLKRLSNALADGDAILACIQASAINQDGATNGLTAPNGLSQEAVIRQALVNGRIEPGQITYVETHGTGTALGDPIEVEALANVIGQPEAGSGACYLGSIKTNIGHLEAAAGIAGLIKAVLALQHGTIPQNLHFQKLNPHISLANTRFALPISAQPWPASDRPRYAAVSSFGFGGANSHLILKEAPPQPKSQEASMDQLYLLPLSARSSEALRDLARAYQDFLAKAEPPLSDICYSASLRRSHLDHRLGVVGQSPADMMAGLQAFLQGEAHPGVAVGQEGLASQQRLVFVFSGQGAQWPGMGQALLKTEPVFRATIEECDTLLRQQGADWSLLEVLMASPAQSRLEETQIAQPAIFALQMALVALWRSWGLEPGAVVGHSVGEVAAACAAGVISLAEAVRVIFHRGRLMQQATGLGKMAAFGLSQAAVESLLGNYRGRLSVAAINSPISTVLSGDATALAELLHRVTESGVFGRMLPVDYAFHSPQMEPFQQELVQALNGLAPRPPILPLYSTVTGGRSQPGDYDAIYWGRNIREPVRFAAALEALEADGHNVYVEIGPHPVLCVSISQCLNSANGRTILPSLHRDQGEQVTMLRTLSALYSQGYPLTWPHLYPSGGQFVCLPAYPWQRQRYWLETAGLGRQRHTSIQPPDDTAMPKAWLYELAWRPQVRRPRVNRPIQPGRWLIFSDKHGLGEEVVRHLSKRGETYTLVFPGAATEIITGENYQLNPGCPESFQQLLDQILSTSDYPLQGVIYLWSLETVEPPESITSLETSWTLNCESLLYLVQALAKLSQHPTAHPERLPQLWLVTKGAQSPETAYTEGAAVSSAMVWGLGRVIALEHPELWGGLIDLDPVMPAEAGLTVSTEVWESDGEDQVVYRRGRRYVARLAQSLPQAAKARFAGVDREGTYLITGGLGGLGLQVARWLAAQGARHLILTSRTGLPDRSTWAQVTGDIGPGQRIAAVQALEASGARVTVVKADVSNMADMTLLFETFGRTLPPLRGVIHTAGTLASWPLLDMEVSALHDTLRPKVKGGWILHQLTQEIALDFFVLFSSGAAIWGAAGMGHYAAANHFLDALAHYRRALKLPALSVNWGWWGDGGMATPEIERYFTQVGMEAMPTAQALAALEYLLTADVVQKTVAAVDWQRFKPIYEAKRHRPLLAEFEIGASLLKADSPQNFTQTLQVTAPAEQWEALLAHVRREVAQVLGFDLPEGLDMQQGFFKMGMNSIMTVQLRTRLERSLNCSLPSTVAFEYPTIHTLTRYLASQVLSLKIVEPTAPPEEAPPKDISPAQNLTALSEEDLLSLFDNELAVINELVEGDER